MWTTLNNNKELKNATLPLLGHHMGTSLALLRGYLTAMWLDERFHDFSNR